MNKTIKKEEDKRYDRAKEERKFDIGFLLFLFVLIFIIMVIGVVFWELYKILF
jgi:uncharacterized ion transporter superfamily protein YfcC